MKIYICKKIMQGKRQHFVTSTISTSLVLFMFSLFGLLMYIGNNLSGYLKENILMTVYLIPDATADDAKNLLNAVHQSNFAKDVKYIDKSKSAEEYAKELGQDFVNDIGYNPLPSMIEIYLKQENATTEKVSELKNIIKKNTSVSDIDFQNSLLNSVEKNIKTVAPFLLIISLILAIISIFLINNTVKLNIYTQRFIIKSMQYVGATENFIMKPFLKSAVSQGLYAGIAASLLVFNSGYLLLYFIPDLEVVLPDFHKSINLMLLVLLIVVLSLCGIFITLACSWLATRKYLHLKIDNLY